MHCADYCTTQSAIPSIEHINYVIMCALQNVLLMYACNEFIGGALLIVLDQVGLQDVAEIDNTVSTLDNLMENIVQDDVFADLELTQRYTNNVNYNHINFVLLLFILIQMSDCSYHYFYGKCRTYFSC